MCDITTFFCPEFIVDYILTRPLAQLCFVSWGPSSLPKQPDEILPALTALSSEFTTPLPPWFFDMVQALIEHGSPVITSVQVGEHYSPFLLFPVLIRDDSQRRALGWTITNLPKYCRILSRLATPQ